jgi:hypothetical protein
VFFRWRFRDELASGPGHPRRAHAGRRHGRRVACRAHVVTASRPRPGPARAVRDDPQRSAVAVDRAPRTGTILGERSNRLSANRRVLRGALRSPVLIDALCSRSWRWTRSRR